MLLLTITSIFYGAENNKLQRQDSSWDNIHDQGVIQKNFLSSGSTKNCDHDCDLALLVSSCLVSSCFGYIEISL